MVLANIGIHVRLIFANHEQRSKCWKCEIIYEGLVASDYMQLYTLPNSCQALDGNDTKNGNLLS